MKVNRNPSRFSTRQALNQAMPRNADVQEQVVAEQGDVVSTAGRGEHGGEKAAGDCERRHDGRVLHDRKQRAEDHECDEQREAKLSGDHAIQAVRSEHGHEQDAEPAAFQR